MAPTDSVETKSTTAMYFVDTNVLLYAISKAPSEASKAAKARAILDRTDLALSSQVLQEFYVQATHIRRADRLSRGNCATLTSAQFQALTLPDSKPSAKIWPLSRMSRKIALGTPRFPALSSPKT